jgi:hypothetical protein
VLLTFSGAVYCGDELFGIEPSVVYRMIPLPVLELNESEKGLEKPPATEKSTFPDTAVEDTPAAALELNGVGSPK